MIKMYGSGLVASWRPHEEGGGRGATLRASEKACDSILVFDDVVLMQHHDGFWETGSLSTCAIIWTHKPEVFLIDPTTGREIPMEVKGETNTIADGLKVVLRRPANFFAPMESSTETVES